jgi:hypothetical protein
MSEYGKVISVSCPKPLVVTQQTKDPNCGFAFIRYQDPRDLKAALFAIDSEKGVSFDGVHRIKGKEVTPSFWPTEASRRYY